MYSQVIPSSSLLCGHGKYKQITLWRIQLQTNRPCSRERSATNISHDGEFSYKSHPVESSPKNKLPVEGSATKSHPVESSATNKSPCDEFSYKHVILWRVQLQEKSQSIESLATNKSPSRWFSYKQVTHLSTNKFTH